jgi:hypothetical protein
MIVSQYKCHLLSHLTSSVMCYIVNFFFILVALNWVTGVYAQNQCTINATSTINSFAALTNACGSSITTLTSQVATVNSTVVSNSASIGVNSASISAVVSNVTTLSTLVTPKIPPIGGKSVYEFYGDSICWGVNSTFATSTGNMPTARWTYLVSQNMNVTENNQCVSGSRWTAASNYVYNHHTPGSAVFYGYGINDIAQSGTVSFPYEMISIAESMIIYSTLPNASFVNPRNAQNGTVAATGFSTWSNTPVYNNIGLGSQQVGDFLVANVTGRFVALGSTITSVGNGKTNHGSITIWVDGMLMTQDYPQYVQSAVSGNQFYIETYIYDTGSAPSANHIIKVQVGAWTGWTSGGTHDSTYIDWFAGWSSNSPFSPVVLTDIQRWHQDYGVTGSGFMNAQLERIVLNNEYRSLVNRLRQNYNMPIYLVQGSGDYGAASLGNDELHPNPIGHQYIANRVLHVLRQGEYTYMQ